MFSKIFFFCFHANLSNLFESGVSFHGHWDVFSLPQLCWHCSKTLRIYPVDSPCEWLITWLSHKTCLIIFWISHIEKDQHYLVWLLRQSHQWWLRKSGNRAQHLENRNTCRQPKGVPCGTLEWWQHHWNGVEWRVRYTAWEMGCLHPLLLPQQSPAYAL